MIGRDYFDPLAEDEVGFVAKILRSLRRSKKHENVVFWAYHFLECFVRGLNPYIQIYYTACGLLKELIDSVLTFKPDTPSMIVQITFDLMGEVTKFNLFNLTAMDRMLTQEGKSQEFYKLVDKNLVDSNVFIRSLLQSEFYRNTLGKDNLRSVTSRTIVHSRGARRARGAHFGARGCPSSSAMPERSRNFMNESDVESPRVKEKTSKRGYSSNVGSRKTKNLRTELLTKLGYKMNTGTNTWTVKSEIEDVKTPQESHLHDDEPSNPWEQQDASDQEPTTNKLSASREWVTPAHQAESLQKLSDYPSKPPHLVSMLISDLRSVLWRLLSSVTPKSVRYDSRLFLTSLDICCINTAFIIFIVHSEIVKGDSAQGLPPGTEDDPWLEYFREDEILEDSAKLVMTPEGGEFQTSPQMCESQLKDPQESAHHDTSGTPRLSTALQFEEVCRMWLNYYTNKPKEGFKLEANTMFRWNVFMAVRKRLLARSRIV